MEDILSTSLILCSLYVNLLRELQENINTKNNKHKNNYNICERKCEIVPTSIDTLVQIMKIKVVIWICLLHE